MTIFADASAPIAIIADEPKADALAGRLEAEPPDFELNAGLIRQRTEDQGLATGSRRTRIDRSVTVTSAPLSSASSILGQMPCSNAANAAASRPSFRIRITDGLRLPLVASRE
jgi:uncharacterized protein with PIN domain